MFRPNRPRRFGPRAGRGPLARPALRALNQAHRFMAAGEYHRAAGLFSQLAQGAQNIARPLQAANLHAQAGLAFAEAGEPDQAVQHGRMALRGFLALKILPRYQSCLDNLTSILRDKGLAAAADQLQAEFEGQMPPQPAAPEAPPSRPRLPAACPQCGAPVRSNEVEWIDDYSAECAFCGAVVQGP